MVGSRIYSIAGNGGITHYLYFKEDFLMKAAIARKAGTGATLHLEEMDIPVPKEGEALVRVHYAGICGTDMHIITGHYTKAKFPLVIGHEFVGEVVEVNSKEPAEFTKGEKVAIHPIRTCGKCDACL